MATDDIVQIVHIAKQYAKESLNNKFSSAHIVKALLNPQFNFLKELDSKGIDVFYIEEWAEIRISELPKVSKPNDDPAADDGAIAIFEEAEVIASNHGTEVEFSTLLITLVTPGIGFSHDQLKSLPVTVANLTSLYVDGNAMPTNNNQSQGGESKSNSSPRIVNRDN